MKKLFVILAIGVFFITSCQKDENFEQGFDENWEESGDNVPDWGGEENEEDWNDENDEGDWDDSEGENDDDLDLGGEDGALTLYKIEGNNISKIKDYQVSDDLVSYQTNDALHQEVWNFVTTLIPLRYRGKITQFELFHGGGELLGYVSPIDGNDLSKWRFALAIDQASGLESVDFSNDFTYTTLHEHGHVLTLNDDQVNSGIPENSCTNYHTGEGCSNSNSYINKIVEIGWKDIIGQHDPDDSYTTYEKYKDRFLTEYAATNPGEDIAEVFTAFVIQENKPSGNSIADQKVKAFYGFPELVTLRKDIRASLNPARLKSLNIDEYKALLPKLVRGHKH